MTDPLASKSPSEIAKLKITVAKRDALSKCPFFAYLLLVPDYVEEDIPTMATDGEKIFYGVKFVNSISLPELLGVLIHEVMHCALLHITRKGIRDKKKWNYAADYAVNILIKDNDMVLPDKCLYEEKYRNMSVEQIYAEITKNPPPIVKILMAGGDGNGVWTDEHRYDGDGQGNEKKDASHDKLKEQEWKMKIAEAAENAKQQGKLPAGIERLVDQVLEEKVPWQQLLSRYLTPFCLKTDYTWSKPNKKHLQNGIIMPGFTSDCLELVVAVDTSGSISHEDIKEFIGEIRGILQVARTYTIKLLSCDEAIHSYYEITECTSEIPTKLGGGGGTSFVPVFEKIAKENWHPACLIYFTDGYGDFPSTPPCGYETIWAMTKDSITADQVPFGKYIKIDFNHD